MLFGVLREETGENKPKKTKETNWSLLPWGDYANHCPAMAKVFFLKAVDTSFGLYFCQLTFLVVLLCVAHDIWSAMDGVLRDLFFCYHKMIALKKWTLNSFLYFQDRSSPGHQILDPRVKQQRMRWRKPQGERWSETPHILSQKGEDAVSADPLHSSR